MPNPPFHDRGDFDLDAAGRLRHDAASAVQPWTYANIALLRPALVESVAFGQRAALGPLLFSAAQADRLAGRVLAGAWHNLGTPEQLAALQG